MEKVSKRSGRELIFAIVFAVIAFFALICAVNATFGLVDVINYVPPSHHTNNNYESYIPRFLHTMGKDFGFFALFLAFAAFIFLDRFGKGKRGSIVLIAAGGFSVFLFFLALVLGRDYIGSYIDIYIDYLTSGNSTFSISGYIAEILTLILIPVGGMIAGLTSVVFGIKHHSQTGITIENQIGIKSIIENNWHKFIAAFSLAILSLFALILTFCHLVTLIKLLLDTTFSPFSDSDLALIGRNIFFTILRNMLTFSGFSALFIGLAVVTVISTLTKKRFAYFVLIATGIISAIPLAITLIMSWQGFAEIVIAIGGLIEYGDFNNFQVLGLYLTLLLLPISGILLSVCCIILGEKLLGEKS